MVLYSFIRIFAGGLEKTNYISFINIINLLNKKGMKIKQLLTKTLLVAAGLFMGMNAWADGNKRVLNAQNYELADATDWTCTNGNATLKTGDATYGKYAQCTPSGSGNRAISKSVTFSSDPSGYTTSELTTAGYNIEFDFVLVGGNTVGRSESIFRINTSSDPIFTLSQPTLAAEGPNEGIVAGKTGTAVTTWYINDLTNATDETVTLDGSTWYHLKLVVTATSAAYTITNNSTSEVVKSGSKTIASITKITGFGGQVGRGAGKLNFDNLDIYDFTSEITVSAPSFGFDKVDGINRVYTITNKEGSGTLYYTTAPAAEAPAVGNAAYTSTSELTVKVNYSESGNYYAYVLHTNGVTASTITSQAVTAGALTLASPQFTIVDMVKAEDGFYYPQVTFTSNNASLEGAPTATYDQSSPYTFTVVGSLNVTASADGYTSSSNTFEVKTPYVLSKSIDFGAMTASDFDLAVWTEATGVPRDYWTDRGAAIPADVTYYKLTDTSVDNSAVLDGITITNSNQRVPEVYIGYGLLTPYAAISGSGNYMNFTVNGGTASDYIAYNGWNNYGNGTFNTILAGNATFGLYRYDTMLRTIKIYSPTAVPVEIKTTGTTFSSAYAIDCDNLPLGVTAYKVTKMTASQVTAVEVSGKVAANTGLILKATADGNFNIPVAATGETVDGNLLKAAVAATPVEDNEAYGLSGGVFKKLKAGDIPAGKAYLLASDITSAPELSIDFGGELTGIADVRGKMEEVRGDIFDLQGRKVAQPQKGLYIQNGRKVILK